MFNPQPNRRFVQPSLGFHCSKSSLHTDNLSFIGTKLDYEITLTEWLKVPKVHTIAVRI